MLFNEILGLGEVKQSLIQSVKQNHVAHAQLFHGTEGSGALALAIAYATFVNCEDKNVEDACGKCPNCLKMSKLAHPDVSYIFPTAGGKAVISENFMSQWRTFVKDSPYGGLSDWLHLIGVKQGNIPAEESRQLIQKLSLKSYEGAYKIVIIWKAEYLNIAAGNALLKLLEEPPEQTLFLLVTNESEKLLTTIVSRTQRVAIRKFNDSEIFDYLIKKYLIPFDRAKQIAYLADGNMNYAIEIALKTDDNQHQWFAEWMRKAYVCEVDKLLQYADEFDSKGKEFQKSMLEYGLNIFREIFLHLNGGSELIRLEGDELIFVQKFSKVVHSFNLEKICNVFTDAYFHIERNGRAKIIFLDMSLAIWSLMKK